MDYKITKLTSFGQIREGDLYLSTLQTTSKLPLVRVTNVQKDRFDYDGTNVSTGYSGWFSDKSYLPEALIVRPSQEGNLEFLVGDNIPFSTIGNVAQYIKVIWVLHPEDTTSEEFIHIRQILGD